MQLTYRQYARKVTPGLLGEGTRIEGLKRYFNFGTPSRQVAELNLATVSTIPGDCLELIVESEIIPTHYWKWTVPERDEAWTIPEIQQLVYQALRFDPIISALVYFDDTNYPTALTLTSVTPGVATTFRQGIQTQGFAATFTETTPASMIGTSIPYGVVVTQTPETTDEYNYAHLPMGGVHPEELFLGITAYNIGMAVIDDYRVPQTFPPVPLCNDDIDIPYQGAMSVVTDGAVWVKLEDCATGHLMCPTSVPMYRTVVDPTLPQYTLGQVSAIDPTQVGTQTQKLVFPVDSKFVDFYTDERLGDYGLILIDNPEVK